MLGGLKPDFKTIADFRRDNSRGVSRRFPPVHCCCADGSTSTAASCWRWTEPIKAVNNKDRNFTRSSLRAFIERATDEQLNEYLERLDEGDVADGATSGGARTRTWPKESRSLAKRGRYQAMLAQLEQTGEDQISLTDPDSRAMAAHTKVAVGYNIQVAVDAKNKLIVEQAVTSHVVDTCAC